MEEISKRNKVLRNQKFYVNIYKQNYYSEDSKSGKTEALKDRNDNNLLYEESEYSNVRRRDKGEGHVYIYIYIYTGTFILIIKLTIGANFSNLFFE